MCNSTFASRTKIEKAHVSGKAIVIDIDAGYSAFCSKIHVDTIAPPVRLFHEEAG